jgi:hypothetical protein
MCTRDVNSGLYRPLVYSYSQTVIDIIRTVHQCRDNMLLKFLTLLTHLQTKICYTAILVPSDNMCPEGLPCYPIQVASYIEHLLSYPVIRAIHVTSVIEHLLHSPVILEIHMASDIEHLTL